MSTWTIGKSLEILLQGWEHLPLDTQRHIALAINKAYELGKQDVSYYPEKRKWL
jgi:hypothetical protein